ncbi:MAG: UDP-glucose 4-epimerase GalE, partial [Alphaproteobacteria bacterium]
MTVLVTGGAGYIGSHFVLAAVDRGERPVVLDNLVAGRRELVAPEAQFVQGDIADLALVRDLIRRHEIDAIVHFAGSLLVDESVVQPLAYYENNTVNSRGLIDLCVKEGVRRFLFSSTAAVYGAPERMPITEDMPKDPVNPYGRSKLMTEWILADTAHAHDLRYIALRYFNVAGADPKGRSGQVRPKATHLINVASEVAAGKRARLDIYGTDYPTP